MVWVKFASVLIGTTGIGLMASLTSIQGLVGTLFGLGIGSSAVREVAAAVGRQDDKAIGTAVRVLRRISWFTGLAGMAAMMLFSPLLSQLTFGSNAYIYDIAALGLVILFGNIASGQMALIQGMRRIGDIARVNIIGAIFATVAAIGFYTWLGLRGIVPALVSIAAMQLAISWYFARRVPVPPVVLGWRQTFSEAGGMVRLGLVFMLDGAAERRGELPHGVVDYPANRAAGGGPVQRGLQPVGHLRQLRAQCHCGCRLLSAPHRGGPR